jgi:hypothetical protein
MKKTRHTPGPWKVGRKSSNPGEGLEIAAKSKFIAWGTSTYNEDKDEDVITGEDRANARLIAAAPELLGAIKGLIDQLEAIGIPDWHGAEGLCLKQARAATAKAEGRA